MENQIQIHNYKIIEKLGHGAFSVVYKGQHVITNKLVAIKILKNAQTKSALITESASLKHECKILSYLNRERVECVPTLYWCNRQCMATTYYASSLINPNTLYKTLSLCEQIIRGIQSIHNTGIVHSDLKPDNFMMDEHGHVKIIDFGLSSLIYNKDKGVMRENKRTEHLIGSCRYASYNLHMGNSVSFRDDLISIGYIMMELFGLQCVWHCIQNSESNYMFYDIKHPDNVQRAKLKQINNILTGHAYMDAYFTMAYKLKYEEIPDYNKFIHLFSFLSNS